MRAVVYTRTGDSDVLGLVERAVPEPGPDEVRVRVRVSGVNPTDWQARRGGGSGQPTAFPEMVPGEDGAGTVDAVGPGVPAERVGQRVWLWEAAWQRAGGTAQEFVVLPQRQAVPLPDGASFDLGASLGIPALTAHRCLTVHDGATGRLGPANGGDPRATAAASGQGVSRRRLGPGAEKAALARAAGAATVVNYREGDPVAAVRAGAPDGVDIVVEVAPAANAALDAAVAAVGGTVAAYEGEDLTIPLWPLMRKNIGYQFVLVYTVPAAVKRYAVEDVSAAVSAGALRVGAGAGLPLHRYPLAHAARAHDAVEGGAVGKVLIDID